MDRKSDTALAQSNGQGDGHPPIPTAQGAPPPISKRKAKKAEKLTKKIKVVPGSVDVRVQHTNDDSVVSKRSAVSMGYVSDAFLRHFVQKPSRRAPLINRGYYLRMIVMTDFVTRAINHHARINPTDVQQASPSNHPIKPIQVISLGAGYDTFAFRTLAGDMVKDPVPPKRPVGECQAVMEPLEESARGRLQFFDVDFPAVMQAKAALMAAAPEGSFPLKGLSISPRDADVPVRAAQYHALGVDLREAKEVLVKRLQSTEADTGFSTANPTIVYAECVMQYMPAEAAAELVAFIAQTFPNAIFAAYDQLQPLDNFGRVMMSSLKQKNSPLLAIEAVSDGPTMVSRARTAGMQQAFFADFYRLSRFHICAAEHRRLCSLEAFDEWEEWAEMCEHYGITVAFTNDETCTSAQQRGGQSGLFGNPSYLPQSDIEKLGAPSHPSRQNSNTVETNKVVPAVAHDVWPSSRFGFEGWGNGEVFAEPHPTDPHEVIIVSFGGFCVSGKVNQRVSTVFAHGLRDGEMHVSTATTGDEPPALVFHSVTRLSAFKYVVFGGRTNPDKCFNDAYLLTLEVQPTAGGAGSLVSRWRRLINCPHTAAESARGCESGESSALPLPRFRHSAVALGENNFFVFGGCGVHAERGEPVVYNDAWIGHVKEEMTSVRWEPFVSSTSLMPPAVFSATLTPLEDGRLLMVGGLSETGNCNEHSYVIDVSRAECVRYDLLALGHGGTSSSAEGLPRFSHAAARVEVSRKPYVLVLGGCVANVKATDMRSNAYLIDATLAHPPIELTLPDACPPSLARHSLVEVARGVVAVVGGGYTCFSFGTFTSRPFFLTLGETPEANLPWVTSDSDAVTVPAVTGGEEGSAAAKSTGGVWSIDRNRLLSLPRRRVEERLFSKETFLHAVQSAVGPVVFRDVNMGPCVARWQDPEYLKRTEGSSTVSVHVGNAKGGQSLDFVRKNFTFRHVSFADLVQHVEDAAAYYKHHGEVSKEAETWYFRSVATNMKTERANLAADFPAMAADFILPPEAHDYVMPRLHQSCLRLNAAPLQLWTHYDTFDNILCQVVGRKRVVFFPPSEYNNLYIQGSSSPVLNIDNPDIVLYPRFIDACKRAVEVELRPGDILYFPANWFHHITTLTDDPDDRYSISVNLFFEHFATAVYDKKDLYGNKDIPAVVELRERIAELTRAAVAQQRLHGDSAGAETRGSEPSLPATYAQFALRQAIQDIQKLADEMAL